MSLIKVRKRGNFRKTNKFLNALIKEEYLDCLDKYGKQGVEALKQATPRDTGKTADSWSYEILRKGDSVALTWNNSNISDGCNVAVLLQYGHGTKTGGYVKGINYIDPALKPIFEEIAKYAWKEVCRL